jgi:protein-glutamine gamma-glutamyltransferase
VIHAGSIPSRRSGEVVSVPVELRYERGRAPCGLEVSSPDASGAVFIRELEADRATHLTLRLQTRDTGTQEHLQVVVRSLYPLGIFTAQRVIEVPVRQTVRPRAAGGLPLPPAEAHGAGKESHALSTTGHRGDGGDFAGVRPWQAGDPLRHVDWKAVARGRPMMVKRWAADSDEVTWLDWSALDLPPAERANQMARWMDDCVAQERVFGLRLPGKKIPPGVGVAHANRAGAGDDLHEPATQGPTRADAGAEREFEHHGFAAHGRGAVHGDADDVE